MAAKHVITRDVLGPHDVPEDGVPANVNLVITRSLKPVITRGTLELSPVVGDLLLSDIQISSGKNIIMSVSRCCCFGSVWATRVGFAGPELVRFTDGLVDWEFYNVAGNNSLGTRLNVLPDDRVVYFSGGQFSTDVIAIVSPDGKLISSVPRIEFVVGGAYDFHNMTVTSDQNIVTFYRNAICKLSIDPPHNKLWEIVEVLDAPKLRVPDTVGAAVAAGPDGGFALCTVFGGPTTGFVWIWDSAGNVLAREDPLDKIPDPFGFSLSSDIKERVRDIHYDSFGDIWITTENTQYYRDHARYDTTEPERPPGLYKLNGKTGHVIQRLDGFFGEFAVDSEGNIYVHEAGGGQWFPGSSGLTVNKYTNDIEGVWSHPNAEFGPKAISEIENRLYGIQAISVGRVLEFFSTLDPDEASISFGGGLWPNGGLYDRYIEVKVSPGKAGPFR